MLPLWVGIAVVALFVCPVAFVVGRVVGKLRVDRERRAYMDLSRALKRFLAKSFPRPAQQYSTIRREEAEELMVLLIRCDQLAGAHGTDPRPAPEAENL